MNKDQLCILGDFIILRKLGSPVGQQGSSGVCWHPNIYRGIKSKSSGDHDPIFIGTKTKTPQLCLAAVLD